MHSVPKFPPTYNDVPGNGNHGNRNHGNRTAATDAAGGGSYAYPHSGLMYGQTMLCVSFASDQLESIGIQVFMIFLVFLVFTCINLCIYHLLKYLLLKLFQPFLVLQVEIHNYLLVTFFTICQHILPPLFLLYFKLLSCLLLHPSTPLLTSQAILLYTLLHTHTPPLSLISINLYTIIQPLLIRPYIHHRPLFLYSLNTPFQPTSSYTLLPPPRSLYPLHLYHFPGHQFLYTTPWIYSSLLPGNTSNLSPTLTSLIRGEKTLHSPPWSSRVKLTSLQGLEFTSFAKHRKFGAGMMILT